MTYIQDLTQALTTAYIDGATVSNVSYKPQFISNNYKEGKKVLASIEDELLMCDQFQISVAFITLGGIEPHRPFRPFHSSLHKYTACPWQSHRHGPP